MNTRKLSSVLVAVALAAASPSVLAQKASKGKSASEAVAAKVNGQSVSMAAFEAALKEQLQRGLEDNAQLRQAVRQELVLQTLLAQQAKKDKMDQSAEAKAVLESVQRAALSRLWQQDWLSKNPVKPETVETEYKALIGRLGDTEYQVRHVLLKDETAARLVLQQAQTGTPMSELAKQYSEDQGSKAQGGLLNWSSPATLVPGLGEALKTAEVSKLITRPVQSQAGWHVVFLEGKRGLVAPTLDQLRPQLTQAIAQRELAQAVQALANAAKIE